MVSSDPLSSDVALFLIQCILIIIVSRIISYLFAKIQQPSVIAEIISGIVLGPTALGKIPGFTSHLFTPVSVQILNVFAQIGLIFFMFIIGLELDPTLFKSQIKKSALISFASIALPFGLGVAASVYLAQIQGTEWTYSLGIFIGVALCITAFPVLARILTAKKLLSTPIGILAIACAAINDICGWILLGLSVSLAGSSDSLSTLWTLLSAAGFCAVMIVIIRPILNRAISKIWIVDPTSGHIPSPSHILMSAYILLLFIASWCTEWIGIHAMFGAFVFGAITPKTGAFNQAITEKIEDLVIVFLLPLYFVVSGLKTDLTTLNSGESWLGVLVIVSCACAGKVLGAGITSKIMGYGFRDSLSIGVLMNTRGLVELIVLNMGLDFGIISKQVFGIMVLMAVFTTILTSPLISILMPDTRAKKPISPDQMNVVFCTSSLEIGPSIVDLGYSLSGGNASSTPSHPSFIARKRSAKKIYILALSEVNDRPSDFIGQIRKDLSKSAYSHLVAQGTKMKLKVSFNQICSDNEHLAKEAIQFSESKASSLLIISEPSHGHGRSIGSDVTFSIIKNSTSHVGVFTDRSGMRGGLNRFKKVLIVYFAGKNPNDEETLNLANKMSETDTISITIVVFDNDSYWKHKSSLQNSSNTAILKSPKALNPLSETNQSAVRFNQLDGVISPGQDGVPIGDSGDLNQTTNIFTKSTLQKFENHLEKVIHGKNALKFNVIYKPKKAKALILQEYCHNYDLLVVPYEATKQEASQGFPSFNVTDLMRKSLSMVNLPGYGKKNHSQVFEMESIHSSGGNDEANIEELNKRFSRSSGAGSGSNDTTDSNNFESPDLVSQNVSQLKQSTVNKLKSSDGIEMGSHDDEQNSSNSGEDDHEKPYWMTYPISTLVIYHKDTIPLQSDILDDHKQNSSGSSTPNHQGQNFDNLEPYEVDPSNLPIQSENPNNNNNLTHSNNSNEIKGE